LFDEKKLFISEPFYVRSAVTCYHLCDDTRVAR